VTGSDHGTITLWDVDQRTSLQHLTGHEGRIEAVAYSTDGNQLVSVGSDKTTRIWDLESGEAIWVLADEYGPNFCAGLSPDALSLVEGVDLRVWDIETQSHRLTLRRDFQPPFGVVYSPDGKRIASTGADVLVRIWDAATGLELLSLSGLAGRGRTLAFTNDGLRLAAAGEDGLAHVWDATPLDQPLLDEREAGALLRFLADQGHSKEQLLQLLQTDASISDAVRARALQSAAGIPVAHGP
jgi:WD40 repeat protein